jgi:hypothetical protein
MGCGRDRFFGVTRCYFGITIGRKHPDKSVLIMLRHNGAWSCASVTEVLGQHVKAGSYAEGGNAVPAEPTAAVPHRVRAHDDATSERSAHQASIAEGASFSGHFLMSPRFAHERDAEVPADADLGSLGRANDRLERPVFHVLAIAHAQIEPDANGRGKRAVKAEHLAFKPVRVFVSSEIRSIRVRARQDGPKANHQIGAGGMFKLRIHNGTGKMNDSCPQVGARAPLKERGFSFPGS